MGDTFGHVVPGIFYCIISLTLIFVTRVSRKHHNEYNYDFSTGVKSKLGWSMFLAGGFGFVIEGLGGLLYISNFFYQIAHETMYLAFFTAGIGCILEASGRAPNKTWRVGFVMAFFVEGMVFYGHSLEQFGVERMLHFLMTMFSWLTAFSFACSLLGGQTEMLAHVLGLTGMLAKGLWFFIIADILYSGKYGAEGKNYMIAMGYTHAGLLLIFLFAIVGSFIAVRPAGTYTADVAAGDVGDEEALVGKQAGDGKA